MDDSANNEPPRLDVAQLHSGLIDYLKNSGHITDPLVEAAFRAVPRHLFLPGIPPEEVYRDVPIPVKFLAGSAISSSSQPAIMAIMLEQLHLKPGQRVLEIGAGTGYNAALISHIVGETGQVVTIDIDEDIVHNAHTHLLAAGFARVQVICADGGLGYPSLAPYDRIILTVGASDITPAWHEQLHPNGLLLLPLTLRNPQVSVAFKPDADHLISTSTRACGFMMLRGAFAEQPFSTQIGPDPLLFLALSEPRPLDIHALYQWLTGPSSNRSTHIQITPRKIFFGLHIWLALHEMNYCQVSVERSLLEHGIIPPLFPLYSSNKFTSSFGLLGDSGLSLLTYSPLPSTNAEEINSAIPFELFVRSFGSDNDGALTDKLIEQITAWNNAGSPTEENLHIEAYPRDTPYFPNPNEIVLQKQWTQLVISWGQP